MSKSKKEGKPKRNSVNLAKKLKHIENNNAIIGSQIHAVSVGLWEGKIACMCCYVSVKIKNYGLFKLENSKR